MARNASIDRPWRARDRRRFRRAHSMRCAAGLSPGTSLARRAARAAGLACAIAALAGASAPPAHARGEPPVLFEVDLARYELRVALDGKPGPRFAVAAGSPRHPTPRGTFPLETWIANPGFTPGPEARRRGARAAKPSGRGPLGLAKVPFKGSFQLHGGAHPLAVGKPVTLGCLQLTDAQMRTLGAWLTERGVLAHGVRTERGEVHHRFARPALLIVH